MAYKKASASHSIKIFNQNLYARAILAAEGRGQTMEMFAETALANEVHVYETQAKHTESRDTWRNNNGTSLPGPMQSALKGPPRLR